MTWRTQTKAHLLEALRAARSRRYGLSDIRAHIQELSRMLAQTESEGDMKTYVCAYSPETRAHHWELRTSDGQVMGPYTLDDLSADWFHPGTELDLDTFVLAVRCAPPPEVTDGQD